MTTRTMPETPRTSRDALKSQGELVRKSYENKIARLERELAAAIEQRDKAVAALKAEELADTYSPARL